MCCRQVSILKRAASESYDSRTQDAVDAEPGVPEAPVSHVRGISPLHTLHTSSFLTRRSLIGRLRALARAVYDRRTVTEHCANLPDV